MSILGLVLLQWTCKQSNACINCARLLSLYTPLTIHSRSALAIENNSIHGRYSLTWIASEHAINRPDSWCYVFFVQEPNKKLQKRANSRRTHYTSDHLFRFRYARIHPKLHRDTLRFLNTDADFLENQWNLDIVILQVYRWKNVPKVIGYHCFAKDRKH